MSAGAINTVALAGQAPDFPAAAKRLVNSGEISNGSRVSH
jgi:hypothetical protein